MYLQKATQYQGGVYVGTDESGNLYKGVVAFMISGLKNSIPYIVVAIPGTTITGAWLVTKMTENIKILVNAGFTVRAVIADNHSTNVTVFSKLLKEYGRDSSLYIEHPRQNKRTYLFFDSDYLIKKNIRNNLLNGKKLIFPSFHFDNGNINIHREGGYISLAYVVVVSMFDFHCSDRGSNPGRGGKIS